jgi:hypothetical protein
LTYRVVSPQSGDEHLAAGTNQRRQSGESLGERAVSVAIYRQRHLEKHPSAGTVRKKIQFPYSTSANTIQWVSASFRCGGYMPGVVVYNAWLGGFIR